MAGVKLEVRVSELAGNMVESKFQTQMPFFSKMSYSFEPIRIKKIVVSRTQSGVVKFKEHAVSTSTARAA